MPNADDSTKLDDKGIKWVHWIVGALLYYARAVNTKLLVSLIKIGPQQAAATENTNEAITQLLDYVSTYPNNWITYQDSDIVLARHSNAAYLNVSKSCSRAGSHIFLSEDDPVTLLNVYILTISQIIKFVVSSAAKAELAGLFITAKAMLPIRQSIIEMVWPQLKTSVQMDNSTAEGVTNNNIVKR